MGPVEVSIKSGQVQGDIQIGFAHLGAARCDTALELPARFR
jgi:hypothetical protein